MKWQGFSDSLQFIKTPQRFRDHRLTMLLVAPIPRDCWAELAQVDPSGGECCFLEGFDIEFLLFEDRNRRIIDYSK